MIFIFILSFLVSTNTENKTFQSIEFPVFKQIITTFTYIMGWYNVSYLSFTRSP